MLSFVTVLVWIIGIALVIIAGIAIYDRFIQKHNVLLGNFPFLGRGRYVMHHLRPLFRQYFGDDDAFAPRIIIDWILHVAAGKTGYFSFDKFDTTFHLHDGTNPVSYTHLTLPTMDSV